MEEVTETEEEEEEDPLTFEHTPSPQRIALERGVTLEHLPLNVLRQLLIHADIRDVLQFLRGSNRRTMKLVRSDEFWIGKTLGDMPHLNLGGWDEVRRNIAAFRWKRSTLITEGPITLLLGIPTGGLTLRRPVLLDTQDLQDDAVTAESMAAIGPQSIMGEEVVTPKRFTVSRILYPNLSMEVFHVGAAEKRYTLLQHNYFWLRYLSRFLFRSDFAETADFPTAQGSHLVQDLLGYGDDDRVVISWRFRSDSAGLMINNPSAGLGIMTATLERWRKVGPRITAAEILLTSHAGARGEMGLLGEWFRMMPQILDPAARSVNEVERLRREAFAPWELGPRAVVKLVRTSAPHLEEDQPVFRLRMGPETLARLGDEDVIVSTQVFMMNSVFMSRQGTWEIPGLPLRLYLGDEFIVCMATVTVVFWPDRDALDCSLHLNLLERFNWPLQVWWTSFRTARSQNPVSLLQPLSPYVWAQVINPHTTSIQKTALVCTYFAMKDIFDPFGDQNHREYLKHMIRTLTGVTGAVHPNHLFGKLFYLVRAYLACRAGGVGRIVGTKIISNKVPELVTWLRPLIAVFLAHPSDSGGSALAYLDDLPRRRLLTPPGLMEDIISITSMAEESGVCCGPACSRPATAVCTGCAGERGYCGESCQALDWNAGHRNLCERLHLYRGGGDV